MKWNFFAGALACAAAGLSCATADAAGGLDLTLKVGDLIGVSVVASNGALALNTTVGAASNTTTGSPGAVPTSTFAFVSRAAVSTANCPSVTGEATSWCNNNWPAATYGTVYLYTFTETRLVPSTYPTLTRTAYVYRPATVLLTSTYPLLVYLHGATQTGDLMFAQTPFAQLADARGTLLGSSWLQNSATCKEDARGPTYFGLGGTSSGGFIDSNGVQCTPPGHRFTRPVTASSFFVAYPNGIPDVSGGGDSWEDGRTPSPGQYNAPNPNDQKRDDVGFINALIATVKTQEAQVNATRVYVAGISNGGIMTHRLVCNAGNSNYPEIDKVAAFSVAVSSMADNIYAGTNGREQCPSAISTPVPLALFVGYGALTPNSAGQPFSANCNPYNPTNLFYPNLPACPYAPVSGDGTMPYGLGYDTGGGTYTVDSRTLGNVIASWDDQSFWLNFIGNSGGGGSSVTSGVLGYFTHYRHYGFANSPATLQIYEVDHGLHQNGGTRYDYSATARIYDFLFEFAKNNGVVSTVGGTYNAATATYSNLSGIY
ncbi:MAG: hypothetical protein JWR16_3363 [Nevskia sp.]|nr:hypothetical protein [Nevskia sp.]